MHWRAGVGIVLTLMCEWMYDPPNPISKSKLRLLRLNAFVSSTSLGFLLGIAIVYFQSIWLVITIHAAWNIVIETILLLVQFYIKRQHQRHIKGE